MTKFTEDQVQRYARHIILPNIGGAGQRKLLDSKVLVIGAGGLGSPIALYLAAAGIGTLGIVDFDKVDVSNLQRQILHTDADVGRSKVESAVEHLRAINPTIDVVGHDTLLFSDNVFEIMEPYDVVIDGTDNFPVRYLVNDATQFLGKPLVYGSIYQFEGQATVFMPGAETPCYRCLFPSPPPPGTVPSCAEGGVFGVLPGVIGAIQATEAIKLITGEGETLVGRLLLYDALHMDFQEVKIRWDADCPVCGKEPSITELIDYEAFCGVPHDPSDHTKRDGEGVPTTMVTVKLPTILRKHAGGEARVSADGATLRDMLANLEQQYPGITKNVLAEDGGLHRFINVYVNDEDVRYLGSLETEVDEGDTVSILPAVAGG